MDNPESKIYKLDKFGNEILDPKLIFIIAFACGITVANLYWAQPLLDSIAHTFRSSPSKAGMIVTFTQIGYAAGLLLIVPLGDLLERRKLIVTILILTVIALVFAAFSPSLYFFLLSSLAIGITSVVAQILVPFAATLAKEHERGKVVGQVMSGLLLGILFARTLAGFISEYGGWRTVFIIAAILILLQLVVLQKKLPKYKQSINIKYVALLVSVFRLVKEEKVLRRRSVYGALVFAEFSVLWTSLTFLLAGPPYNFSDAVIGLFGLVGAAGAFSANIAGRKADKGKVKGITIFFLIVNLLAFLFMSLGTANLYFLILGIVMLDAGVQGTHITNQSEIYRVRREARSRLTTAYMTSFFIGGAFGSATSAFAYEFWGWTGVVVLGIIYSIISILYWFFEQSFY